MAKLKEGETKTTEATEPAPKRWIVVEARTFRRSPLIGGQELIPSEVDCSQGECEEWAKKGWIVSAEEFAARVQATANTPPAEGGDPGSAGSETK